MKTNTFPTIAELSATLKSDWFAQKVEYDVGNCNFKVIHYTEYPCYDDGGSIDSVDFVEEVTTVSFYAAYCNYMNHMRWLEELPF